MDVDYSYQQTKFSRLAFISTLLLGTFTMSIS